ncbi:hypothetical protein CY34DRAFT_738667 [Suillus luteus UH-Slu-Lm8-n1]|uniref:Uncharacterized protein n=1 Tax=Suillus luteus UH-Slu-Lm8-n1 TaxID=930992 RepID=A0A0C9Z6E2_9AGAM|nr:hypothetical protein CY34DRAFT_738667 [Suillus luteus UH-Slu-Lm8-n1]
MVAGTSSNFAPTHCPYSIKLSNHCSQTTIAIVCIQQEMDVQPRSRFLGIAHPLNATNFGAQHPSAQPIPSVVIPDLTKLITRCVPYPVSGGAYGDIYKCIYHGLGGDVEVCDSLVVFPCLLMRHLPAGRRQSNSTILQC